MSERAAGPDLLQRRGRLLNFGGWTVFGLIAASQQCLLAPLEGEQVAVWRSLTLGLVSWWWYAAVTPLILRLGRAVPLDRGRPAAIAVHLAAALAVAIGHALLD